MTPPVHVILEHTPALFDRDVEVARHAAATIDGLLRGAPVGLAAALDRAFRDAGLHRQLGLNFIALRAAQVERLGRLGSLRPAALAVASLVRSGHIRELAVRGLCECEDPLVLPFLLRRLNDYVGVVAELAWQGLERRLQPVHAPLFVRCLALLERMSTWVRAVPARRERLRQWLLRPHPACRQALWDGLRARDEGVALQAAKLLVTAHAGGPEMLAVLTGALAARDPRTRRWAALRAIDAECTPRAVLLAITPRLAVDRAPAVRAIGLQARVRQGDRAGVEAACFDPRASLRFQARAALAERFTPLDYRGLALLTLASARAQRAGLIAALGTLAEFGRAEDLGAVAAYVDDPRASVAREARRTLAALRGAYG